MKNVYVLEQWNYEDTSPSSPSEIFVLGVFSDKQKGIDYVTNAIKTDNLDFEGAVYRGTDDDGEEIWDRKPERLWTLIKHNLDCPVEYNDI